MSQDIFLLVLHRVLVLLTFPLKFLLKFLLLTLLRGRHLIWISHLLLIIVMRLLRFLIFFSQFLFINGFLRNGGFLKKVILVTISCFLILRKRLCSEKLVTLLSRFNIIVQMRVLLSCKLRGKGHNLWYSIPIIY